MSFWRFNLISRLANKKGFDLNAKNEEDETPILLAALNGYGTIVKYLHDHNGGIQGI